MLTISVHGIALHAKVGLYADEKINGNDFEIDVDVFVKVDNINDIPFIDYSILNDIVIESFREPGELLETFLKLIHQKIKIKFPEASKVKVAIKKMTPPMEGSVKYASVSYEG